MTTSHGLAWLTAVHAFSSGLVRKNDPAIATIGRVSIDTGGQHVSHNAAFRTGLKILAPEKSDADVPVQPTVRHVPIGISSDGALEMIVMTRDVIEASEVFQTASVFGADYRASAAHFVWSTGLMNLRALTAQNLQIVDSVMSQLPKSFGKGGPRHWELSVETAIATINPSGARLSPARRARHLRNLEKSRSFQFKQTEGCLLLERLDPHRRTLTLDESEQKFFISDFLGKYVIFDWSGRICSSRPLLSKKNNEL